MLIIEETTRDWTTHVGSWEFGFMEKETWAWGRTRTDTSIHIGPLTTTFHATITTVAWAAGGIALVALMVIGFLIARLAFKTPAGRWHG